RGPFVVRALGFSRLLSATFRHSLLDRADHVEGLLGKFVVLAVEDLAEALDRALERPVPAADTGELLGAEVWLRKEALDLPRPGHGQLVLVGELVHAENVDDGL